MRAQTVRMVPPSSAEEPNQLPPTGQRGTTGACLGALIGVLHDWGLPGLDETVPQKIARGEYSPEKIPPKDWEGQGGLVYALALLFGEKQRRGQWLGKLYPNNPATRAHLEHFVACAPDAETLRFQVVGWCEIWERGSKAGAAKRKRQGATRRAQNPGNEPGVR